MGKGARTAALDVHEKRVGRLYEPLQLVRPLLVRRGRVQQINGERLRRGKREEVPSARAWPRTPPQSAAHHFRELVESGESKRATFR